MTTTLFVGTQGRGIFAVRFDEAAGTLAPIGLVAEVERPTWLLRDPERPILYAVSEVGNAGDRDGEVLSFAIDGPDGTLTPIGRTSSGGGGATHLTLDAAGGTLFVANFGGGQVAAIPVGENGRLGPVASIQATAGSGPHRRQGGPHPHGVTLDPARRILFVPDMGADRIFAYRYHAEERRLDPAEPPSVALPAGSGPRLLLFGPDGRFAYLLTELSAEIHVFRRDAEAGALAQIACIPLDDADAGTARSAAALTMSPDGRFLYVSNRATDAIQVYALAPDSGLPRLVQRIAAGGAKPWAAELSPGGRWLAVANQASDRVRLFAVDPVGGTLTPTGAEAEVAAPTGLAFARHVGRPG